MPDEITPAATPPSPPAANDGAPRLVPLGDGPGKLERHPTDGWTLTRPLAMSWATQRLFRGLISVIAPIPEGPNFPDALDRVEIQARELLAYVPRLGALGLVVAIWLLAFSTWWRLKSVRLVYHLPRERAAALLSQLDRSRLKLVRLMIFGVRAVVLSSYFDQPEVHAAMGYDPVGWMHERIEVRRRLLQGERARAQDLIEPTNPGGISPSDFDQTPSPGTASLAGRIDAWSPPEGGTASSEQGKA